jgi:hypothetical protein
VGNYFTTIVARQLSGINCHDLTSCWLGILAYLLSTDELPKAENGKEWSEVLAKRMSAWQRFSRLQVSINDLATKQGSAGLHLVVQAVTSCRRVARAVREASQIGFSMARVERVVVHRHLRHVHVIYRRHVDVTLPAASRRNAWSWLPRRPL